MSRSNNLHLLYGDGPIAAPVLLQLAANWGSVDLVIIGLDGDLKLKVGSTTDNLDEVLAALSRAQAFILAQYP